MYMNIHPDHLLAAHRVEAAATHERASRRRLLQTLRRAARSRTSAPGTARREARVVGRPATAS